MTRPIWVYGTLRPGEGNARVWLGRGTATCDGECYVCGYALVSNGGFPYLVPATMAQTVGALIHPQPDRYDEVLAVMDHLEGYRPGSTWNHYERITVPVIAGQDIVSAWTYVPTAAIDIAGLPDVETNADGRFDWQARTPRRFRHR